jgi:hypothetical protein
VSDSLNNNTRILPLDAAMQPCYDAPMIKGSSTVMVGFFFFFYFGDDTRPHLLRVGESATAPEEA